jgi:hypothetical protein
MRDLDKTGAFFLSPGYFASGLLLGRNSAQGVDPPVTDRQQNQDRSEELFYQKHTGYVKKNFFGSQDFFASRSGARLFVLLISPDAAYAWGSRR